MLFRSVTIQQLILLYHLPDISRVNRLWLGWVLSVRYPLCHSSVCLVLCFDSLPSCVLSVSPVFFPLCFPLLCMFVSPCLLVLFPLCLPFVIPPAVPPHLFLVLPLMSVYLVSAFPLVFCLSWSGFVRVCCFCWCDVPTEILVSLVSQSHVFFGF